MSLWFKPAVFKLKKGIPAIIVGRPFLFCITQLVKEKDEAGHGLVRRRHMHVGAPDNRINGSLKSMS